MPIKVYARSTAGCLRQGEIIEALTQPRIDVEKLRAGELQVHRVTHGLVIVLSQDCDLEQDYSRRSNSETDDLLPSVVFCAVEDAVTFRGTTSLNSKEWKRVERNNEPRYHFLRALPAEDDTKGEGLGTLAVDFKQYFALRTDEAYYWLETAIRRCRLESPYLEHLAARFSAYFSRIALPLDHHQDLPVAEPGSAGSQQLLAEAPAAEFSMTASEVNAASTLTSEVQSGTTGQPPVGEPATVATASDEQAPGGGTAQ
jgi:hypothetical protein